MGPIEIIVVESYKKKIIIIIIIIKRTFFSYKILLVDSVEHMFCKQSLQNQRRKTYSGQCWMN